MNANNHETKESKIQRQKTATSTRYYPSQTSTTRSFPRSHRYDANAKFMTASDMLGRLKLWGNIERSMPINKFGQLLQKRGFVRTKYQGIAGYVVVENSTPSDAQKDIAQELLNQEETDSKEIY